jgi:integrase/recombinase XerD
VDRAAERAWEGAAPGGGAAGGPWRAETADLLSWLLAGRRTGPLFLTGRKAPPGVPAADECPVTGRARMSYRRAAEIFTGMTRVLHPSGRGWTLHQLSAAGGAAGIPRAGLRL